VKSVSKFLRAVSRPHTYFECDALNRLTAYKVKRNPFAA
jgi:hypothetical protein